MMRTRSTSGRLAGMVTLLVAVLLSGAAMAVNPARSAAATLDTSAWYVLVNRNSGKALDGLATNDGARITQWTRNDGANQQRQLGRADGGQQPAGQFTNPVVWQDFADVEVIRVGGVYYLTASTMHYSPGAPILRSYDLVSWEFAGHSVPSLEFGTRYDLASGERAYVKGIWASTLAYRPSNRTYYWAGCIEFNDTFVYTASSVDGPWNRHAQLDTCYYNAGMLIDDNDTMYVAYGNTAISVAQLSADGRSQVRAQQVFQTPSSIGTLEGARFYKRGNSYYIWLTRPANGQYVLKSDGTNFVQLGNALTLNNTWQFFMGYRFAIFNYATQSLGGAVTVRRFDLTTP